MKYKYENLEVWELSKQLIKVVYRITSSFPKSEEYNLTSQIKRAVISVALNITEGSMRKSKKEFRQFLRISLGSLVEVDTCLKIAAELGHMEAKGAAEINPAIEKLYFKLIALEKSLSDLSALNGFNGSNKCSGVKR